MENKFGAVAGDRVIFNMRKGMFSGWSREDIPVRHITSIRHDIKRHPLIGIIFGIVALVAITHNAVPAGIVCALVAVFCFLPRHHVKIHTSGAETRISYGGIGSSNEAEEYATAVREALFSK